MRSLFRFLYMLFVLLPPTVYFLRFRNSDDIEKLQQSALELRLAFQKLGPTFIKLGQMLTSRPDIIGIELAEELRNLLDNESPLPFITVKRRIESELKKPLKQLFKHIKEDPIATASIAQVHKATLFDGTTVAVKVQTEGLTLLFQEDLLVLKRLTSFFDLLLGTKRLQFRYIYKEFAEWIARELDFEIEGRNIDRFSQTMQETDGILIPTVYWNYTTKRILTTTFIKGETMNSLLTKMKKQNTQSIHKLKLPYIINPDLLMQRMLNAFVKQVLIDKHFHGDLHPANIIVTPNNEIALIDFGITGIINAQERIQLLYIILGVIDNDPKTIIDVLVSVIAQPLSLRQLGQMHQEIATILDKVHHDTGGRITFGNCILTILSISSHYRTIWTPGLLLAAKTIVQIDSIVNRVGIEKSVISILKPEFEKNMIPVLTSMVSKEKFFKSILDIMDTSTEIPRIIANIESLTKLAQTAVANRKGV